MNEKYQADVIIQSEWIENSDLEIYDCIIIVNV